jgi:antitoxin VapB
MLCHMPIQPPETDVAECRAELFRDDHGQAVLLPHGFEMDGSEVFIRKESERLIVTPVRKNRLLDLLATWEPIDEGLPEALDSEHQIRNVL